MRVGSAGTSVLAGVLGALVLASGPSGGAWSQNAAPPNNLGEGWVTEIRPPASSDATQISEDLISRYVSDSASEQPMGEYAGTLPVRHALLDVAYGKHGLIKAATPGNYRFAVTFVPHGEATATYRWICWPHLDFIDGGNRVPVLPLEPIEVQFEMPPSQVKTLISSVVAMPAGLSEAELDAQCEAGDNSRPEGFAAFLHEAHPTARTPNPWPTMVISVQRPGENGFSPLRKGEVLHDRDRYRGLSAATAGATPVVTLGGANPVKALGLSPEVKPGWYIDVYGIAGDETSWMEPPATPVLGTFIAPPASFSLNDHRRAGLPDKDGKIYIANSRFLVPEDGRYTFVVVPVNPAATDYENDTCLAELTVIGRDNNPVTLIGSTEPNLRYSSGPQGVSVAAVGGGSFVKGDHQIALRAACASGARPDLAASHLGDVRFNIYVRGPDDNFLQPAGAGTFVYRPAK